MLEPVLSNPWVRALGAVLALVLLGVLVYLLSPVLVPLFFAFLVAYTLDPVVDFFERRKISRTVSIALLATTAIVLAIAIPVYVVPAVITQADALIEKTKEGDANAEDEAAGAATWLEEQVNRLPLKTLVESLGWDTDPVTGVVVEDYDPLDVLTENVASRVKESATTFLRSHTSEVAAAGATTGTGLLNFLRAVGSRLLGILLFFGNLALFAFVAVYLLKDYDSIIGAAKELVPLRWRSTIFRIMGEIDGQVRGFLRGQMLVCLCLGVMYAAGLMVAGVPFALLIATFGAVASFIPYLGLALTIGPALILCFMQHGLDWHIGVAAGTFIFAQVLEGTVLTPKIVGEQVGLGPVWVILAVLVFGNALGFLGLLLAVPIAASLKVLVVELLNRYKSSPAYQGPASGP